MNKIAIVVAVVVILMMMFLHYQVEDETKQKGTAFREVPQETVVQNKVEIEPNNNSLYEHNLQILKQYVEITYNSNNKNNQSQLKEIISDDLFKDINQTMNVDSDHRFETKVKHAKYTVNKDVGIAVFTLKTSTEANESEQIYLLEVKINNGVISEISRMTRVDNK